MTTPSTHASSNAREGLVPYLSWACVAVAALAAIGSPVTSGPGGRSHKQVLANVRLMANERPFETLPLYQLIDSPSDRFGARGTTLEDTIEYFDQMKHLPSPGSEGQDRVSFSKSF